MRIITALLVLFAQNINAQNEKESLLSKIYFPFTYGISLTPNTKLNSGNLAKTGIEYRFNRTNGVYLRYDNNSRKNEYKISQNLTTNVTEGELNFNDNIIGIGYRLGKKKLKAICLFQTGLTAFEYPSITGTVNNYKLINKSVNSLLYKFTIGTEYYIGENIAITIETDFLTIPKHSLFWSDNFTNYGFSIGLMTTLF